MKKNNRLFRMMAGKEDGGFLKNLRVEIM